MDLASERREDSFDCERKFVHIPLHPSLEFNKARGPGKPASECNKHNLVSFGKFSGSAKFVKGDEDRGCGCVAVFIQIDPELIHTDLQLIGKLFNYIDVSLMAYNPVDI